MVEMVKANLKRVADQSKQSTPLPVRIQHPYQYTKWDSIHEPFNVVENVLRDDASVYKALSPAIDLTLSGGQFCFVAEALLYPGDTGPASVQCYVSNVPEKWTLVKEYKCSKSEVVRLTLPGEQVAKYFRVKCVNNVKGGNIVSIRYIVVKGIIK